MLHNKIIRKVLIISILLISSIEFVVSQEMINYTWDAYHMTFNIPKDFEIKKSGGNNFAAGNSDIYLSIYPRLDEHLVYEEMEEALMKWANSSDVLLTDDGIMYLEDLNGYWGVMADGIVDNWPIFLMLIIDPDYPNTSLYVWLSYSEDKIDIGEKILFSITPN